MQSSFSEKNTQLAYEKEIFGRDFFFQCVSSFDKEWDMLSVSLLCRTTQQQQSLSPRMS